MASQHQSQVLNKNLCPLCRTVNFFTDSGRLAGTSVVWSHQHRKLLHWPHGGHWGLGKVSFGGVTGQKSGCKV